MSIWLYFIVIWLIFHIIGSEVLKLFGKILKSDYTEKILLSPLIGMALMICISQLLSIGLPTSQTGLIWMLLVILILIVDARELFRNFAKCLNKHKFLFIISFFAFSIWAFPMLKANEMLSFQYMNNDIIYYMSTMEWLQDNPLISAVHYTASTPFFICAEYIFRTTRYGTDILGSVFMQILNLHAHEIFSFMGIIYIILSGHGIYYFCMKVLKVAKKHSTVITGVAMLAFAWKELLILQYIPQIAGVCGLLLFITCLIEYFTVGDKLSMIMSSLFLAATACTYAEFSSYMFIIYIGIVGIQCICTKQWGKTIKEGLCIGFLGVIFNPLGFYIAVKFNFSILNQVSVSASNIDAYGGNILSKVNIIAKVLGGPDIGIYNGNMGMHQAYLIIIIVLATLFLVTWVYMLMRKRDKNTLFLLWILLFFGGYELYFHYVHLAYGEYKHLIGISAFVIVIFLWGVYVLEKNFKNKVLFGVVATAILLMNIAGYQSKYSYEVVNEFVYDHTIEDIRDGITLVPSGKVLGILGNAHFLQHLMVYAAKDTTVQLMGEGVNSYFSMLGIPLNNEVPDYILCTKDSSELTEKVSDAYDEIWNNERYMIVKILKK